MTAISEKLQRDLFSFELELFFGITRKGEKVTAVIVLSFFKIGVFLQIIGSLVFLLCPVRVQRKSELSS